MNCWGVYAWDKTAITAGELTVLPSSGEPWPPAPLPQLQICDNNITGVCASSAQQVAGDRCRVWVECGIGCAFTGNELTTLGVSLMNFIPNFDATQARLFSGIGDAKLACACQTCATAGVYCAA